MTNVNYFKFEEVENIVMPGHFWNAIAGAVVGGVVVVGGVTIGT